MKYDFDKIVNRRGTYSAKYDGVKLFGMGSNVRFDEETIPMMVADMDFECPPAIVNAMHRVADHTIYGYTMHGTDERYFGSIVDWYKRRYDTVLNPEHIMYSAGSVVAINHAMNVFSNPGDEILITRPVYGHFTGMIESETCHKTVSSHLIDDGTGYYTMDWADFEAKCARPSVRIFILCSPANPIGRVWTKEEIIKMAEICRKNHVLLISDEIHSDILRAGVKHYPITSIVEDLSNIIMVIGTNKSFNVAGLHCSNVVIPDDNLRGIFSQKFRSMMSSPFSTAASIAAYDESEDWLNELNKYLDESIDWSIEYLKEKLPKVRVWKPEGTYMLWLDFTAYGLSGAEVHERIYNKANVMLQDGNGHDPEEGECFQRMCIACPRSMIKEAIDRMSKEF